MDTAIVTTKGQLVIPSRLRRRLGIKEGTKIAFEERSDRPGEVVIRPLTRAYFERCAGMLASKGAAMKALLEDRAKDRDR